MTIRYKLTTQYLTTHNDCQWELNEWKETSGTGELCSPGWLHCYSNPLLAILLNPLHANIPYPKLFEVEVEGKTKKDHGLKEGWTRMRLIKELEVPKINDIQKRAFGILCALECCEEEDFVNWANNWLNGKDRTTKSAKKIYCAIKTNYANDYVRADYFISNTARYAVKYADINYEQINLIEIANKAMEIK